MEAPRETTPPPLQAPTAKERKYDRQLRLWAASGQRALEESHVLLVVGDDGQGSNSSVAGSETLKNLVLPSIGNFTIADSANVTEADLGVNFFLEADSLGKSRAEEMTRLLMELNPDVTGQAESRRIDEWLPKADSLKAFNLFILCAPIATQALQRISNYATERSIPVIHVQSAGFYSSFSIQLPPEFPIVDTHPDPDTTQDLRLLAPWPELAAEASALTNIDTLSDHDHGHIPYILLLLYYLEKWKSTHDNQYPTTFKEKTGFRALVAAGARTSSAEGAEENYDEACAAVLKAISPPGIGSGCREMFAHPSCSKLTSSSANFWIIASAVKAFHDAHGVLPLPGSLPDMKARSSDYIRLQNTYKTKARADVAEVTARVRATESTLHISTPVSAAEIEQFCKNASHLRVLTGTPLPQLRLEAVAEKQSDLLDEDADSLYPIFHYMSTASSSQPAPFPKPTETTKDEEEKPDEQEPTEESQSTTSKIVTEVSRCQHSELHNISSVTGGTVAQEAIKLLTRQYVPVNNTCIYDGIRARTEVLKL